MRADGRQLNVPGTALTVVTGCITVGAVGILAFELIDDGRGQRLAQFARDIPKKHRDKFNPTFFDVDHGYDRPLYFVLLKDQYELRPDGTGGISFFTIAEFRDCLSRIVEVQA